MKNQNEKMEFVVLSFYVDLKMKKFIFSSHNETKIMQISTYCRNTYIDIFEEVPSREMLSVMFRDCIVLERILYKFLFEDVEKM